ncbi:Juvenile hormone-inducible protein [Culex quinquefasciatus]|uniref:Juvenile hormone-inducible protein n=1 Tax=Culex quinquefasciatus TaxID=7176 RepID=B0XJX4_CULQU|nr:Juvenile hormone-inducible protein [Culex quinquefasciatus]|eukprot:XP_001869946.1 Juvenile hormone-inducible protein [Culex quinquefasciatus]
MKPGFNVPRYVQDGIRKAAASLQFSAQHTVDYDFRSFSTSACVAVIYQITLREEPREVTLLCKVPPADADDTVLALFEREVFVYQQLLPTFVQFQQEHDILPSAEEYIYGPTCFYGHFNFQRREGLLILEDVGRRLFGNRNKFEPIDYDSGRLAMVQLGRFHAVSLALKEQHPELFARFQQLGDVSRDQVADMEGFRDTMNTSFDQAIYTLNIHETVKKEKLTKLKDSFVEELKIIADSELSEPFCVVCHGDFSASNLMYSYNSGFPNRLIMLDWQLAKYGSPALDFLHFMFLSTDERTTTHCGDHLERLGGDHATERFPLTTLMRLIKTQAKYAVTVAVLHVPLMLAIGGESGAAGEENGEEGRAHGLGGEGFDGRYQARMSGLLKDAFRLGYL